MHWCYLNTKSFRRYSAFKNTYWDALVGPWHKIFSVNSSYQKCILRCFGGTIPKNLFSDFQLSRILIDMHCWDLKRKSFRRFSAIKNTYWHALVGIYHKIFSAIFRYPEYFLTCIGVTWTQSRFGDIQLSRKLIDMQWRDFNTKSFRRFSAIKNTYWHALVGPEKKIFSAIFSYQEKLLTCIGGTLTQNLSGDFQLSRIVIDMHWWEFTTKSSRRFSDVKEYFLTCIDVTWTQSRFGDIQLSRTLIEMHWWDLDTKSFRWIQAIKNVYWDALVGLDQKIFSAIFSYQENLLTCIGRTWTQNLFGEFQLSRILIGMHWWDLNTKSFRWI